MSIEGHNQMKNDDVKTISIEKVASMLGISRNLAYSLARKGELPGVIKLGQKRLVVSKVVIEKLLENCGQLQG